MRGQPPLCQLKNIKTLSQYYYWGHLLDLVSMDIIYYDPNLYQSGIGRRNKCKKNKTQQIIKYMIPKQKICDTELCNYEIMQKSVSGGKHYAIGEGVFELLSLCRGGL